VTGIVLEKTALPLLLHVPPANTAKTMLPNDVVSPLKVRVAVSDTRVPIGQPGDAQEDGDTEVESSDDVAA
jgi:hypothetical protein